MVCEYKILNQLKYTWNSKIFNYHPISENSKYFINQQQKEREAINDAKNIDAIQDFHKNILDNVVGILCDTVEIALHFWKFEGLRSSVNALNNHDYCSPIIFR